MDRAFGAELMAVLSPMGVEASLVALEQVRSEGGQRRLALSKQLEQLRYEARRAFEQYDAVDARNRLVAAELERRWNVKLESAVALETELAHMDAEPQTLSVEEIEAIRALGRHFETVWRLGSSVLTSDLSPLQRRAIVEIGVKCPDF